MFVPPVMIWAISPPEPLPMERPASPLVTQAAYPYSNQ